MQKSSREAADHLTESLISVICPGVAALIGHIGIKEGLSNTRLLDVLIMLPLLAGSFYGIQGIRLTRRLPVRVLAIIGTVISIPYALCFLLISIFGLA